MYSTIYYIIIDIYMSFTVVYRSLKKLITIAIKYFNRANRLTFGKYGFK